MVCRRFPFPLSFLLKYFKCSSEQHGPNCMTMSALFIENTVSLTQLNKNEIKVFLTVQIRSGLWQQTKHKHATSVHQKLNIYVSVATLLSVRVMSGSKGISQEVSVALTP